MRQIKLLFTALTAIFLMSGVLLAQDTTMTITNNGNVGIGTLTPSSKLEVNGTAGVGEFGRFSNHMFSSRVAEENVGVDVAIFGANYGITGFEAGVYGLTYSPGGYGVYSDGNFGVNGNASINGSLNIQAGFRATGPNGSFWFTPEFSPGETILLGVYTGFGAFPVLRFVESNDSQGYVDVGQDGNGDFTVQSAAGVMLSVGRTTGDLTANSINTGAEALKIISGVINPDGNILSGSGYTVERLETGVYKITFTEPFSNFPSVTGTVVNFGYMQFIEIVGGLNVTVGLREGSTLEFFDSNFSFTAIGGASSVPPAAAAPVLSADK